MSKEMTGTCTFCGQTRIVRADTQEEADRMALADCNCQGAEMARTRGHVREQLDALIGELAPDNGWDPVRERVFEAIEEMAYCISDGLVTSCAMRVDDTNLKISRSKGKINVERSKTIWMGGVN